MSPKKETQKSAAPALAGGARESTAANKKKSKGFTDGARIVALVKKAVS